MRSLRTLVDIVEASGWEYGEGFIVGNQDKDGRFLKGKTLLPTEALGDAGIDEAQLTTVYEDRFQWPRTPERFSPPLVLIKEHVSLPVAFWDHSALAYGHSIVGIHAPKNQQERLHDVFTTILQRRRLYQFCCLINGTRALAAKSTAILKQDIDRLPFPDDPSELDLAFWEDALKEDVLNHMADYIRLGQDSDLLKNSATPNDLGAYSSLYVRMLGSLYRNLKADDPVFLNGLIAQPFYFGARPDVSWLGTDCEESLHRLIYDESRESLRTIRVVRYYEGNVILIVKPDRLRYWIRSTAIRDADDTLVELREQGW